MPQNLKYLVIHCTATPEGREVTSDQIRHWHLDPSPAGRGWKQVGYTHLIHLNGSIEQLVPNNDDNIVDPWEITNGVTGINSESVHIVYAGGLAVDGRSAKDTRTKDQTIAMRRFVLQFISKHPQVKVVGHNQFASKACPSFDVTYWCRIIGIKAENIKL
jgi:N-acetyl-anhydromuramyl-L-alanine amidase AmpD